MDHQNIQVKSEQVSVKEFIHTMQEWFRYLLSKWKLIVMVGLTGALLGFSFAYLGKTNYVASTTFVLEDEGAGGIGSLGNLAAIAGVDIGKDGGSIFQGDNILELYKSRTIIAQTLLTEVEIDKKKELLINRYIDFNNLRESWSKEPNLKNLRFEKIEIKDGNFSSTGDRLKDSVLNVIVKDINLSYLKVGKPDKKLGIIKAEVKSTDEVFSKTFNELIVKNVNNFYVQTKTKKSLGTVLILQQKVDSVRAVMNNSIYTAAAISDATPNLNLSRQVQRVAPVQRSQFSVETNKAVLSELLKNLELSKITLHKDAPLIQVLDRPVYPLEKDKFGKAKGILLGGFIGGFLIIFWLLISFILKRIMSS